MTPDHETTVICSWCSEVVGCPPLNPNRANDPVRHGCCGACYQGLLAELEQDCETGTVGGADSRHQASP